MIFGNELAKLGNLGRQPANHGAMGLRDLEAILAGGSDEKGISQRLAPQAVPNTFGKPTSRKEMRERSLRELNCLYVAALVNEKGILEKLRQFGR
jgi:hypothetical protein